MDLPRLYLLELGSIFGMEILVCIKVLQKGSLNH